MRALTKFAASLSAMYWNSGSVSGKSPPKTTTLVPEEKDPAAWCQMAVGAWPVASRSCQVI